MSDYKRFVSYFYPYTPDKQPRSVGFIKIEVRDKKMKIEIQVKGITFQSERQYPVYLFLDDGKIKSYDAGDLRIQKNTGFFRGIVEEGSNGVEDFLFAKTVGACIQNENNTIYAAYWGPRQFSVDELAESLKKKEKEKSQEILKQPDVNKSKVATDIKEKELEKEIQNVPQVKEEELEKEDQSISQVQEEELEKEGRSVSQVKEEELEKKDQSISKVQEEELKKEVQNASQVKKENLHEDLEEKTKEQTIRKEELEDEFAKEQEFFENTHFYECQKIEPKDLRELPKKEWILGKNSFLLHGYYNYRYLIYGKLKKGEKIYRFLGVPGVFHNQEKFMANLFGFSEFEPVKKEKVKTGKFGYWIRIIDEV